MINYTLDACEKLISKYINEYDGEIITINEGCLGLGTVLLHSAKGKKTIIIKEFSIGDSSCGHTIRKYNKIPKKYIAIITN